MRHRELFCFLRRYRVVLYLFEHTYLSANLGPNGLPAISQSRTGSKSQVRRFPAFSILLGTRGDSGEPTRYHLLDHVAGDDGCCGAGTEASIKSQLECDLVGDAWSTHDDDQAFSQLLGFEHVDEFG